MTITYDKAELRRESGYFSVLSFEMLHLAMPEGIPPPAFSITWANQFPLIVKLLWAGFSESQLKESCLIEKVSFTKVKLIQDSTLWI